MANNPVMHARTKHIDIRHHFVRELVADKVIMIKYCPTVNMRADILTKMFGLGRFVYLRKLLGLL